MDHFDIINAVVNGATLEVYAQTKDNPTAKAYLDEVPVSVSQAMRAVASDQIKPTASHREWTAYAARTTT